MNKDTYGTWVDIAFDCLPLRTVTRVDIPIDASPVLAAKMLRVKQAIEKHGVLNSYFLHNAHCKFHFTNDPREGMVEFEFDGTVLTDTHDLQTQSCDLHVTLTRETCSWLNQTIVQWLSGSVQRAVQLEFDRYIKAGDLQKVQERLDRIQRASDEAGGFVGMYL
ncbi:MAG: hypothetical protein IT423_07355 [Pirellulaceae bacterium]|nr:hypothetical protein [Pirellulaceae bacterium]